MRIVMTKHKVSGVPYEVDLDEQYVDPVEHYLRKGDMIAELERENFMLRARIDRLEEELGRYRDDGK
jgi:hypothetical protein